MKYMTVTSETAADFVSMLEAEDKHGARVISAGAREGCWWAIMGRDEQPDKREKLLEAARLISAACLAQTDRCSLCPLWNGDGCVIKRHEMPEKWDVWADKEAGNDGQA